MTRQIGDRRDAARTWLVELGVLVGILVLAALLRLPDLAVRGQWDSDQGHDMSILAAMVAHGELPLLGPPTSVGTFHHGAIYYYLLWPAAALSGADPVAVTAELALIGVAAVAATWWLARLLAGPVAAAVAGLLIAVSPAAISESTFIWNPNPIPLFAAVAYAAALRARQTGRARWWLLAGTGAMVTMQLHWLGGVIVVPIAVAWVLDLRQRRAAGREISSQLRAGAAGLVVLAMGYLPLLVHELGSRFSETRAILAYAAGGGSAGPGIAERLLMVAVRSLTWPIAGLVTDNITASLAALVIVVALTAAAYVLARRTPRGQVDPGAWPVAWLVGTLVWSILALAVLAPSLAVVVPGLPNDHYHAFLDPVVLALAGAGVARLAAATRGAARPSHPTSGEPEPARRPLPRRPLPRWAGPLSAAALTGALVVIAIGAWPPHVSPDGGWALADAASLHVIEQVDAVRQPGDPVSLVGLPTLKSDEAMRFPLTWHGLDLEPPVADPSVPGSVAVGVVTVVCDPLFDDVTGAPCGGPAEERWIADAFPPGTMRLVERFRAGPRRVLSIYAPSLLADAGTGDRH